MPPSKRAVATVPALTPSSRGRLGRILVGPDDQPAWPRPLLALLLLATGVLYL